MSDHEMNRINKLFQQKLQVINVGLASFGEAIAQADGTAEHIEWRPPARGDQALGKQLAKLINHPQVERANQRAFDRLLSAQPVLRSVEPAHVAVPDMGERMILHAGPPIAWEAMCGPMQGAVVGAILYEGWASDVTQARKLAGSGEITFEPCHHHAAVGPMSGILSPSMPVWIVYNETHGNVAFSSLNEGLGKVLRFGANEPGVIDRLKWMGAVLGPALKAGLQKLGGWKPSPSLRKRCIWVMNVITAMWLPRHCCSSNWPRRYSRPTLHHRTSPQCSSLSPATTTFF
jgi:hypothetical protein